MGTSAFPQQLMAFPLYKCGNLPCDHSNCFTTLVCGNWLSKPLNQTHHVFVTLFLCVGQCIIYYLLFAGGLWPILTHPRLGKPHKSGLDIMLGLTWRIQRGESSQFSCQGQPVSYSALFYPAYSYLSKRWQVHSIKYVSHCSCDKPIQVSWSLKISFKVDTAF